MSSKRSKKCENCSKGQSQKKISNRNDEAINLKNEVVQLQAFLLKLLDSYEVPDIVQNEIRKIVKLPEEYSPLSKSRSALVGTTEQKSKEESFMKKYGTQTISERDAMNMEFLAAIPLSPKSESEQLSDLSSSCWSGRISLHPDFKQTQKKVVKMIPKLDLKNLPADSDEEEIIEKNKEAQLE